MKTVYKKYIYWLLSVIFIAGILLSIYTLLGGFDEIKTGISTNNVYSIAGKKIVGQYVHKLEGNLFQEVRELIEADQLKGDLCIVDYQSDTLEEGEINRFIGVKLSEEVTAIPSGYEVIEIKSRKSYIAALKMHPLVMPNSQKVQKKLKILADQEGDSLHNYTFEIYYPDNSVWVEMFAIQ